MYVKNFIEIEHWKNPGTAVYNMDKCLKYYWNETDRKPSFNNWIVIKHEELCSNFIWT
jgi:hypothetical protein